MNPKKTQKPTKLAANLHAQRGLREIGLLVGAALTLFLVLALVSYDPADSAWTNYASSERVNNWGGSVGAWLADTLLFAMGFVAWVLPVAAVVGLWRWFSGRGASSGFHWSLRLLGVIASVPALCGLVGLHFPSVASYLPVRNAGGVLGEFISKSLAGQLDIAGGSLLLVTLILIGGTLFAGLLWLEVLAGFGDLFTRLFAAIREQAELFMDSLRERRARRKAEKESAKANERAAKLREAQAQTREMTVHRQDPVTIDADEPAKVSLPAAMTRSVSESIGKAAAVATAKVTGKEPDFAPVAPELIHDVKKKAKRADKVRGTSAGLPSLDLLDLPVSQATGYSHDALQDMAERVEAALGDFNVAVKIVSANTGPVITRFELEPAPGIKGSQIQNLAKDLARSLSVISVRVVEVIPGKPYVGLEVPNVKREIVSLRDVLQSSQYQESKSPLTMALGKGIAGHPEITDLGKMPHVLVAGTTGAGKSVAVNVMLLSLLFKATPDQLRLILVDPKMLELSVYEGIPHLLTPVVTDMSDAANALRWAVVEMERRYKLMSAVGVRNVAGFNKKVQDAIDAGEPIADPLYQLNPNAQAIFAGAELEEVPRLEPLPYIAIVIDEMADLMLTVGKKVEELILRLAQKARAAGIHLILATQRPSVDVITGLIRANIPSRVAFQVASKIDSRTILDQSGAESLLGMGDMLFNLTGSIMPTRVHGAFVDDHEVHNVVSWIKQHGEPNYDESILSDPTEMMAENGLSGIPGMESSGGGSGGDAETDPLYDEAVKVVTETRRASVSGVQRRLRIGYNRAARLVEAMEAAGVVGPPKTNGMREVLAPPPM